MRNTLIIPDIHADIVFLQHLDNVVKKQRPAKIVMLGDYFDSRKPEYQSLEYLQSFGQQLSDTMSAWVDKGIELVPLAGNHEIHHSASYLGSKAYIYGANKTFRYGFNNIYGFDIWAPSWLDKLKVVHIQDTVDKFIFSHAGVRSKFLTIPWLKRLQDLSFKQLIERGYTDPELVEAVLIPGGARGGSAYNIGGCLWMDYTKEFLVGYNEPDGIFQIFGHSNSPSVGTGEGHIMLDAGQSAYAWLYDNGQTELCLIETQI